MGKNPQCIAADTLELREYLDAEDPLQGYPLDISKEYIKTTVEASRPIWDLAAVSLLVNQEWFESEIIPSPSIRDDLTWRHDDNRHPIRAVTYLQLDADLSVTEVSKRCIKSASTN